jgi:hypothetical protein
MAEAAKAQEPSMEELRARIRRIIAETDDKPAQPSGKEHQEEPLLGHDHVPSPSRVPDSAPASGGGGWEQLISGETNNAVHSAFNALTQTVLLHNSRTLEDMVREMLRPMLKVWLDDNLPSVVERLVRGEIERAQRPARGKPSER